MNYHDITDRKLVEKAYKDSEFKYRSLIEHSSDVVFCVDRNGEYKFVNQVFASTFSIRFSPQSSQDEVWGCPL
jgi:two-component system, chemotaxis family, CheB/CheR fusion protein